VLSLFYRHSFHKINACIQENETINPCSQQRGQEGKAPLLRRSGDHIAWSTFNSHRRRVVLLRNRIWGFYDDYLYLMASNNKHYCKLTRKKKSNRETRRSATTKRVRIRSKCTVLPPLLYRDRRTKMKKQQNYG